MYCRVPSTRSQCGMVPHQSCQRLRHTDAGNLRRRQTRVTGRGQHRYAPSCVVLVCGTSTAHAAIAVLSPIACQCAEPVCQASLTCAHNSAPILRCCMFVVMLCTGPADSRCPGRHSQHFRPLNHPHSRRPQNPTRPKSSHADQQPGLGTERTQHVCSAEGVRAAPERPAVDVSVWQYGECGRVGAADRGACDGGKSEVYKGVECGVAAYAHTYAHCRLVHGGAAWHGNA